MGGAVRKFPADIFPDLVAVSLACLFGVAEAGKGVDRPQEGLFGLQPQDDILPLLDIAGAVGQDRGYPVGIDIPDAALLLFFVKKLLYPAIEPPGPWGSPLQERTVPFVRGIVFLDKIFHVNVILPVSSLKIAPRIHDFPSSE